MDTMKITCTVCPIGCEITITGDKKLNTINEIKGSQCKRGETYAKDEFLNPKRILTSTVKIKDGKRPVISVRTNKPIPKELINQCMEIIKKVDIQDKVSSGDVVINNVLDTGADVIVTGY